MSTPDPGIYGGTIRLTLPSPQDFGELVVSVNDRQLSHTAPIIGVEQVRMYDIPQTFHNLQVLIKLSGIFGSDNVYKMQFLPGLRLADAPRPDRFDQSEGNPPNRPNNDTWDRAVVLGAEDLPWVILPPLDTADPSSEPTFSEIVIPDLNFHRSEDEDWFMINQLDGAPTVRCGNCESFLRITAGEGCLITVFGGADRNLSPIIQDLGHVDLLCDRYINNFPIRIRLSYTYGASINYALRIIWVTNIPEWICRMRLFSDMRTREEFIIHECLQCTQQFYDPADDFFEKVQPTDIDFAGRITKPQFYTIRCEVKEEFNLRCIVQKELSLALQLLSSDDKVIAQAATADLLDQFNQAKKPEEGVDTITLHLQVSELQPGFYILSISHGSPATPFQLKIDRKS